MSKTPELNPEYAEALALAERQYDDANDAMKEAIDRKRDCRAEFSRVLADAWGVPPGARVRDHRGDEYAVSRAEPFAEGVPWLKGHKIKKNGEPGERESAIGARWTLA